MTSTAIQPGIKVITFDLDDTLWPSRPVLERAEREAYAWLDEHAPKITLQFKLRELGQFRIKLLRDNPALQHRISDMRRLCYRELALACGYPKEKAQEISERAFAVFITWRQRVEFFAGVEATLESLAKNYLLGALTNGNANLQAISIGNLFSFAISAESLNASKPDPIVFASALAQARAKSTTAIQPEHIAHVGDDLHTDIIGAKRAGFYSIWLPSPAGGNQFHTQSNSAGKQASEAMQPDQTLRSITQLPQAIAALQK